MKSNDFLSSRHVAVHHRSVPGGSKEREADREHELSVEKVRAGAAKRVAMYGNPMFWVFCLALAMIVGWLVYSGICVAIPSLLTEPISSEFTDFCADLLKYAIDKALG